MHKSGEVIREDAGERLLMLADAICRWNTAVNLVSRKDIGRLVSYHFCDSASLLPLLGPRKSIEVLDVGGSNGLPGLILAALSPYVRVTICDSQRKRRAFLEEICKRMSGNAGDGQVLDEVRSGSGVREAREVRGASDAAFEIDRVDSAGFQARHAGAFDLIVARAVMRLKQLLRWCMPVLKPGGTLVAYKGSRCVEEVKHAEEYLFAHGGRLVGVTASPLADQCNPLRLFAIVTTRVH
jgi:16S rRNA (guanine527-N7)-methyltransferase